MSAINVPVEITVLYEGQVEAIACVDMEQALRTLDQRIKGPRPVKNWAIRPQQPDLFEVFDYPSEGDGYVDVPVEPGDSHAPRVRVPSGCQLYQSLGVPDWIKVGEEYVKRSKFYHIDKDRNASGFCSVTHRVKGKPVE